MEVSIMKELDGIAETPLFSPLRLSWEGAFLSNRRDKKAKEESKIP